MPKIPDLVAADPDAEWMWRHLIAVMRSVPGWVTLDMLSQLSRYALTYAQWRRCEAYVAKNGDIYDAEFIVKEDDQQVLVRSRKRNPETIILKECRAEMRLIESILGIGPVYKAKVDLSGQDHAEDDALER